METCYFPFMRGENSTDCDITFLEMYPTTSKWIRVIVFIPAFLVLLASSLTLYKYVQKNLKSISVRILFYSSDKFSREEILLRRNLYTLFCGTIACLLLSVFSFNGFFFENGFESTHGRVQAFVLFSALTTLNFYPILKKLLGITSFCPRDEKLLKISEFIGMPYTIIQIFIMAFLLTLEDFDIYHFATAFQLLFWGNTLSLAYPPYAISNVLIMRLGDLQKISAKKGGSKNFSSLKVKIKFFRQNSLAAVSGGVITLIISLVRRWLENPKVFLVFLLLVSSTFEIYVPTLVVYSKYVLPGRRIPGVGKRDTTAAVSRMSGSKTSTLEGSKVVPQMSRTKL
eukprot:snap_masked-scaffold_41-processed-gene-2.49-mRNA-1 protein AED:1.00 eAED:1.00 QI:0/0/0/0/1/1/2/0/340